MKLLLFFTVLILIKDKYIHAFDLNPKTGQNNTNVDVRNNSPSVHNRKENLENINQNNAVKESTNDSNTNLENKESKENIKYSFESDPVFKTAYDKILKTKEREENQLKVKSQQKKSAQDNSSNPKNNKSIGHSENSQKKKTTEDSDLDLNSTKPYNANRRKPNLRTNAKSKLDVPGEYEDTNTFTIPYEIPKIKEKKKTPESINYTLDTKIINKFNKIYNLLGQKASTVLKSENNDLVRSKMQKINNCNLNSLDFNVIRPVQMNPKCEMDEVYDPILRLCINIDCIPVEDVNIANMPSSQT